MKVMLILHVLIIGLHFTYGGSPVGPADLIIKLTERCDLSLPSLADLSVRILNQHGKTVMNATGNFPFRLSDKTGVQLNVEIKKSGAWKPNFFKFEGKGICGSMRLMQPLLFEVFAKNLHAPKPYSCPLPSGNIAIINYVLDVEGFVSHLGNLPYGELRAKVNMTHKNAVFLCSIYYADIVPKRSKKKG